MATAGRPLTDTEDLIAESVFTLSKDTSRAGGESPPLMDPRLQLIERIASSEPFQKSSRLPQLIRYLAEHSLQHDRAGLTEQAIGRAVFDKPKDFHPAEDSSVRVYMRQLRLRLHEFYQSVGRDEQILVEVPKGGYALVFHSAAPQLAAHGPVPNTAATADSAPALAIAATPVWRRPVLRLAVPWLLFALAAVAAFAGWYRYWNSKGTVATPWPLAEFIDSGRPTTVVLADASYSLRMLLSGDFTLDDYIHRDRLRKLVEARADSRDAPLLHYLESAQITSIADAHAAAMLVGLAGPSWKNLTFRSAKELTPGMLADSNLIFIGAKSSNPWIELYEGRLMFPFRTGPNGWRYVQNRVPASGEQATYSVTGVTGSAGEDYATISLIDNTGGHGSLLLVQGVRLEGTEAAIRFLADSDRRDELARRLKQANGGVLPKRFEVLLHAHSVAGSAVSIDCIAVRPLNS